MAARAPRKRGRNFACSECGKAFPDNAHLRDHMVTHTGEKTIPCPTCGRLFARATSMRAHQRTHSGEKPHACPHAGCSKRYSSRGGLRLHLRTHAAAPALACPAPGCQQRFGSPAELAAHRHEGWVYCAVCGDGFAQEVQLRAHTGVAHGLDSSVGGAGAGSGSVVVAAAAAAAPAPALAPAPAAEAPAPPCMRADCRSARDQLAALQARLRCHAPGCGALADSVLALCHHAQQQHAELALRDVCGLGGALLRGAAADEAAQLVALAEMGAPLPLGFG